MSFEIAKECPWAASGTPTYLNAAITSALHHVFVTIGVLTALSSLTFWRLRANDGDSVSRGRDRVATVQPGV